MMNYTCPFDLVIGLDRSDRKADLYLIHTASGQTERQTIGTSPEALHDWLLRLRQKYPEGRVSICLEQPAASLILFLEAYLWITLDPSSTVRKSGPLIFKRLRAWRAVLALHFSCSGHSAHAFSRRVGGKATPAARNALCACPST
jgi:hypothetical protein